MSALSPTPALTVLAPMPLESIALRRGLVGATGVRLAGVGMGPASARRAARVLGSAPGPVLVAGVGGALAPGLEPGDVVLADTLRAPDGSLSALADPSLLAAVLRDAGLTVHVGVIASSPTIVRGSARHELAATGALAVDMESTWIAETVGSRPLSVLRVVLDTPEREVLNPLATLGGLTRALIALSRIGAALSDWTDLFAPREIVLAGPRASCAGVDRAVEIVRRVLAEHGPPVYVRKQIVHNAHVVAELEERGAIFVDELDAVPAGARTVFSAHGVSPTVRAEAVERGLEVTDATCPLVAKVHAEARRFAAGGYEIVLVGHAEHEEVEGTRGEAPDAIHVVSDAAQAADLDLADSARVAYLTQTTLAIDETADVVDVLRRRFPELAGPGTSDICYATQNRQDAVRALAGDCDLVLVVGSRNSSNSNRLVEVAARAGAPAALVEDARELSPALLGSARRIGLSAGASAPESLVQGVVGALAALGETVVSERRVAEEDIHFKLPINVTTPEVV